MHKCAKIKTEVRLCNLLHKNPDGGPVNQKMLLIKLLRPGMGQLASEEEPLARFVFFAARSLARSHIRLRPLAEQGPLSRRSLATLELAARLPLTPAARLSPYAATSSHSVNSLPL